jgi:predicted DNA-binding protein YlxM (UPF0122 family)
MKHFGLSQLRFRKFKELLHSVHGRWCSINKAGGIRYSNNIFRYIVKPKTTSFTEFCIYKLTDIYKVSVKSCTTIDQIIDETYSHFILGEYNLSSMGADFKFNTIRNAFKDHFKSREYMINHYSNKLSIPVIRLLKKEFADKDILNVVISVYHNLMGIIRDVESGIIDHVRKQFSLMRAGPINIRSPLTLVA